MRRAIAALWLGISSAAAADYVVDAARMATAKLGQVRAGRAYVLHGYGSGCPEQEATCRSGAYLVAADPVVIEGRVRDFAQIRYADARGRETVGLLPGGEITDATPGAHPAWIGHWVRSEATIDIKAALSAALAIGGDATWGAGDPERVKRGGVNVGGFEGTLSRYTGSHGTGVVAVSGTGDDPTDCRVWVRLLGPYLLVTDDNTCGGDNVSFTGPTAAPGSRRGGRALLSPRLLPPLPWSCG